MKRFLQPRREFRQLLLLSLLSALATSCGSSRKSVKSEAMIAETSINTAADPVKIKIAETAKIFVGTPYKYGGTSERGMDCSGLVHTAFSSENIALPRTSRAMSKLGKRLNLREVNTGDLLFFETDKKKNVINHVGLVLQQASAGILFIHSTTSRGVIISSMEENYWKDNFVMARRVE